MKNSSISLFHLRSRHRLLKAIYWPLVTRRRSTEYQHAYTYISTNAIFCVLAYTIPTWQVSFRYKKQVFSRNTYIRRAAASSAHYIAVISYTLMIASK